jgi:hypothetical protein
MTSQALFLIVRPQSTESTMPKTRRMQEEKNQKTSAAPFVFLSPLLILSVLHQNYPGLCQRTPTQSVCIVSVPIEPLSCMPRILIVAQSSLWFWPFCGTRVWFDHHNRTVCDHNDAFLGRTAKPIWIFPLVSNFQSLAID